MLKLVDQEHRKWQLFVLPGSLLLPVSPHLRVAELRKSFWNLEIFYLNPVSTLIMVGDARCAGKVALDLLGWGAGVIPGGLLLWKSLEAEGKRELSLVQSQSGHFLWDLKCILSPPDVLWCVVQDPEWR